MIFVTLGTQDKPFNRLVKEIDKLVQKGIIKDEVVVQAGCTKIATKNLKMFDIISIDDFNQYIKNSDFIIAHAGVGSILDGLKHNKKVIAVARSKKYGEIINDHQVQIIDEFVKKGYIIGCKDVDELESALKKIVKFKPQKYISNNTSFVNLIDNYLQNN